MNLFPFQASKNIEVQRYASGALWQVKNTERKIEDAKDSLYFKLQTRFSDCLEHDILNVFSAELILF